MNRKENEWIIESTLASKYTKSRSSRWLQLEGISKLLNFSIETQNV